MASAGEIVVSGSKQLNCLSAVGPATTNDSPFPHSYVTSTLDPALYGELDASFPALETFCNTSDVGENVAVRIPAHRIVEDRRFPEIWRRFVEFHVSSDFWRSLHTKFGTEFRQVAPWLESTLGRDFDSFRVSMRDGSDSGEVRLDCQLVVNTPARRASSVKPPHIDNRHKLWSGLLYFRDEADESAGGDLELYRFIRPPKYLKHRVPASLIERARTIRYAPNSFVAFPNSPLAVHGVSPRAPSSVPRRYVNFIADAPLTLFDLPQIGAWERAASLPWVAAALGRANPFQPLTT